MQPMSAMHETWLRGATMGRAFFSSNNSAGFEGGLCLREKACSGLEMLA